MKNIELPSNIETIAEGAFNNCSSLTEVTLPKGLTELGDAAFKGCTSLAKITVAYENTVFSANDGILYDISGTQLLVYPAGRPDTEFTIPDTVTYVGNGAFLDCTYLVSVTMPDTVESTGEGVFGQCSALERVVLSNQITELPYLYLYDQVSNWVGYFENCEKLKTVMFSNKLDNIGAYAFAGCDSFENFVVPDTVTEISIGAFSKCDNLNTLTLGKNVSSYSDSMVDDSGSLVSILVAEGNTSFRSIDGVLFNADETTLLKYPAAKKDTSYEIPQGIREVKSYAFEFQKYLEKVILPESLTTIGSYAFAYAYKLSTVMYPSDFIKNGNIYYDAFTLTDYLDALEPDEDGFVISDEGILFSAPAAEALTVPASVKLVAGKAFNDSSLVSLTFNGDCHFSTYSLYYCRSLKSLTVNGDCILETEFFDNWHTSIKEIKVDGELIIKGRLPSEIEKVSYARKKLQYTFSEPKGSGKANVAISDIVSADTVSFSTYSNSTGFNNGFKSVDMLQEIKDPAGNIYALCGYNDAVTLIPYKSGEENIVIEKKGFSFGAAAIDENSDLYIMWAHSIPENVVKEEMDSENIVFSKYDLHGELIAECGLPLRKTRAQFPFDAGNANMLVKDDILGCLFDTEWTVSSDGIHHQGAEFAAIDIRTMELKRFDSWQGSHSFGVSMIPTEYGFAAIHMGDGLRGFLFNTYLVDGNKCEESYLKENGHYLLFHASGQYGSNYAALDGNTTYLHMGGLAKSNSTYAVAGKSVRRMTSDVFHHSELDTGIYDVFIKLTDKTLFSPIDGLAGVDRIDEATGEVVDSNVIWLTECNENEKAGRVKVVTMEDGSYCVLWEKFVNDRFDSVRYMIFDECGNILRSETEIKNARLSDTSVQPIVSGTSLIWAVADSASASVKWYTVDLESFEDFSERFTEAEEFAAENGLEFSLSEGCYGMCGSNAYWVYLEDSSTLLITGSGEMDYIDPAPWSVFSADISTALIGDGITNVHTSAFEGCSALENISVPDSVTKIGSNAFEDCSSLTELTVPASVNEIGEYAFYYCSALEKMELPVSITEIKDYTFMGCSTLSEINIPSAVTRIGKKAFYNCESLKSVMIFDPETEIEEMALGYYMSIYYGERQTSDFVIYGFAGSTAEAYAKENEFDFVEIYGACGKNSAWKFDTETGKLNIFGNGKIDDFEKGKQPWADYITDISFVVISDNITAIGENAFADTENLKFTILGEKITDIGDNAFDKSCIIHGYADSAAEAYAKANSMTFRKINGKCGENAAWYFDKETGTLTVMGGGSMTDYQTSSYVPWNDIHDEITSVIIEDGITSVASYAFYYCENLQNADLSDSIEKIGSYSFYKCSALKNAEIPRAIKQIEEFAFYNCEDLENVDLPEGIEQIGENAFYRCLELDSVIFPKSLNTIGRNAFTYCAWLNNITFLNPEAEIAERSVGYGYEDKKYSDVTIYGYAGSTAEAYAEENEFDFVAINGECGEAATWKFDSDNGILHIFGSGKIDDFATGEQPWVDLMSDISHIEFSENITAIGAKSFADAENLKYVIIGEEIMDIGDSAFNEKTVIYGYTDSAAESYALDNSQTFIEISGKCGENAVWYFDKETGTLSIMGEGMMKNYYISSFVPWYDIRDEITSVVIDDSITSIGSYAFAYCKALENVNLPENIEQIGEYAFYSCSSLTSISIPKLVKELGDSALRACGNLKNVTFLNPEVEIAEHSIGYYYEDHRIEDLTIYGYAGSTAEAYAEENDITFIDLDRLITEVVLDVETVCEGQLIVGAKLRISEVGDEDNSEVASWTSADEINKVEGLKPEQLYILENVTMPDGYLTAEPVYFFFDKLGVLYISADKNIWQKKENAVITVEAARAVVTTTSTETTITSATSTTKTTTAATSTTEATATTEPSLSYTLGDIDKDGIIDASDASMVLAAYAQLSTGSELEFTEEQLLAADVNDDGEVDAIDASNILAYYAHISTGGSGSLEEFLGYSQQVTVESLWTDTKDPSSLEIDSMHYYFNDNEVSYEEWNEKLQKYQEQFTEMTSCDHDEIIDQLS